MSHDLARAYTLLAALFRSGVTETLRNSPARPALDMLLAGLTQLDEVDLDEAAAHHHHLFSFALHPYESIYLDPTMLVGSRADPLHRLYTDADFTPSTDDTPDHISAELDALAWLVHTDNADAAHTLLSEHVLRWYPALLLDIEDEDSGLYARVARMTLDVLLEHASRIGLEALEDAPPAPAPPELDSADLKALVRYLENPSLCGIFLGRERLARVGRSLEIPRGFGSRKQTLMQLFRSAADYDRSRDLLTELRTHTASQLEDLHALATYRPLLASATQPQTERLRSTFSLLTRMLEVLV